MSTINELLCDEPRNPKLAFITCNANMNAGAGDSAPDVPDNTPPGDEPGPDR